MSDCAGGVFSAFIFGAMITLGAWNTIDKALEPEMKLEELYRFCLVKNIPLEECIIPKKPFKQMSKDDE